jgi:hypothetical protein
MMLKLLKQLLEIDTADYSNMPDWPRVLEHLAMTEEDDPELIRDAIESEIEALEAEGESDDGDDGEGEGSDVE